MSKKILLISTNEYGAMYGEALKSSLGEIGLEAVLYAGTERVSGKEAHCVLIMDEKSLESKALKDAKESGATLIYYGGYSGGSTGKTLGLIDLALAHTPAESAAFEKAGIKTEFTGHPLIDIMDSPLSLREAKEAIGYDWTELPVSIIGEGGEALMRVMFEGAAEAAAVSTRKVRLIVPEAERYSEGLINDLVKISPKRIKVLKGQRREALLASEAAVVAAGTVTLEAALAGVHVLTVKRGSLFSSMLGGVIGRRKLISIPNIILNRPLFPELRGMDATPKRITQELAGLVESSTKDEIDACLSEVREKLGGHGALKRAAKAVAGALG